LLLRQRPSESLPPRAKLRPLAALALLALVIQIALGGWVSSNYAALACADFPTCLGAWVPEMDFARAFQTRRELGQTADGELLSVHALTAIHWAHRVGALIVALLAGALALALALARRPPWRAWGLLLAIAVLAQLGLGVANVVFSLPLPIAVAHNAGAAILLTLTLALNFRLWQGSRQVPAHRLPRRQPHGGSADLLRDQPTP
jgi:cytochrome c oxidase assembly protein subunit 15